ncbi:hypothetical protein [Urbanus proteus nucleopolyhedrovirus]|uniref:Uncharacterized protein n=1 Tax=Urbanus proteus nucleopolyhedrovirus TaxID=1675866 RepID=A0A161C6W8_9ABAC|nr:hypothetical protein [Urbanus proteus nucleopolyhedrovirus]AKR17322.1 hypothetical protein [Urbanus proteus nucleopolyhedrovirus]
MQNNLKKYHHYLAQNVNNNNNNNNALSHTYDLHQKLDKLHSYVYEMCQQTRGLDKSLCNRIKRYDDIFNTTFYTGSSPVMRENEILVPATVLSNGNSNAHNGVSNDRSNARVERTI